METDGRTLSSTPDKMLPFGISAKEAQKRVSSYTGGILSRPTALLSGAVVKKYYVPCQLFDFTARGEITSYAARYLFDEDIRNFRHKMKVTTDGSVRFSKLPVDMSRMMDDELMDQLAPYDLANLSDTDMSAAQAEDAQPLQADTPYEECCERAKKTALYLTGEYYLKNLVSTYDHEITEDSLTFEDLKSETVLLPVYVFTCSSEGKTYTYAVNGQTGEVAGPNPISKLKRAAVFICMWLLLMLPVMLLPDILSSREKLITTLIFSPIAALVTFIIYKIIYGSERGKRLQNPDVLPKLTDSMTIESQSSVTLGVEKVSMFTDPSAGRITFKVIRIILRILIEILIAALKASGDSDSGSGSSRGSSGGRSSGGRSFGGGSGGGGRSSGGGAGRH